MQSETESIALMSKSLIPHMRAIHCPDNMAPLCLSESTQSTELSEINDFSDAPLQPTYSLQIQN